MKHFLSSLILLVFLITSGSSGFSAVKNVPLKPTCCAKTKMACHETRPCCKAGPQKESFPISAIPAPTLETSIFSSSTIFLSVKNETCDTISLLEKRSHSPPYQKIYQTKASFLI